MIKVQSLGVLVAGILASLCGVANSIQVKILNQSLENPMMCSPALYNDWVELINKEQVDFILTQGYQKECDVYTNLSKT